MRLRIKIGGHEVEVEGSKEEVLESLNSVLEYVSLVTDRLGEVHTTDVVVDDERRVIESVPDDLPPIIDISPREPTTAVLEKLFSTSWASKPRSLREVVEALASMGLHYPKSTVAVSLMRLVRKGLARRIKSKGNIYLYVPIVPPGAEKRG